MNVYPSLPTVPVASLRPSLPLLRFFWLRGGGLLFFLFAASLTACQTAPGQNEPASDSLAGESHKEASTHEPPPSDGSLPEPTITNEPPASETSLLETPSTPEKSVTPEGTQEDPPREAQPPPPCQGRSSQPRDKTWTLSVGERKREFRVHLPPGYDPTKPYPLVLNLHGNSSDAFQQEILTSMKDKADKEKFIVVHPEGTMIPKSWNAKGCCPGANVAGVDDMAFVKAMLDALERDLCIDPKRIFSTGMSNGGMMTYRLACELSDRIAAFAPVAGSLVTEPCKPNRPLSLMAFHGTLDTIVPYGGNPVLGFLSVKASVDHFVAHNGCNPAPLRTFEKGDASCDTYQGCKAGTEVVVCTILAGGHTWPGGFPIPTGHTSLSLKATDAMWTFFQKHPLP